MNDFPADIDRKFRLPRIWSNRELARFAPLFRGEIANVSGWRDEDKEGRYYRSYFSAADSYTITNYKAEARGFQGEPGEIFLDLTKPLPPNLAGRFDVVLNHTVLEHIYEVQTAFNNLCQMSRDVVIVVVPMLQQMHAEYGDYWRFTPQTMRRMYADNGLTLRYVSFNSHPLSSVYLFCIGMKHPERWQNHIPEQLTHEDPYPTGDHFADYVGCHALANTQFKPGTHAGRPSLLRRIANALNGR